MVIGDRVQGVENILIFSLTWAAMTTNLGIRLPRGRRLLGGKVNSIKPAAGACLIYRTVERSLCDVHI